MNPLIQLVFPTELYEDCTDSGCTCGKKNCVTSRYYYIDYNGYTQVEHFQEWLFCEKEAESYKKDAFVIKVEDLG